MTTDTAMTPAQAKEFRRARFNSALLALHPTLPAEPVCVRYMNYVWNKFNRRREVIFMCYRTSEFSHVSFLGCFYESALIDFAT
jgi:hypothetical protein